MASPHCRCVTCFVVTVISLTCCGFVLQGGTDSPDLEFVYADADIFNNEIAELYSYTEQPEFQLNVKVNFTIIKGLLLKIRRRMLYYDCTHHEALSNDLIL